MDDEQSDSLAEFMANIKPLPKVVRCTCLRGVNPAIVVVDPFCAVHSGEYEVKGE